MQACTACAACRTIFRTHELSPFAIVINDGEVLAEHSPEDLVVHQNLSPTRCITPDQSLPFTPNLIWRINVFRYRSCRPVSFTLHRVSFHRVTLSSRNNKSPCRGEHLLQRRISRQLLVFLAPFASSRSLRFSRRQNDVTGLCGSLRVSFFSITPSSSDCPDDFSDSSSSSMRFPKCIFVESIADKS